MPGKAYVASLGTVSGALAWEIPTMISSDIVGGSALLDAYKLKLEQIGQIQDRIDRIKRSYELATSSQGSAE